MCRAEDLLRAHHHRDLLGLNKPQAPRSQAPQLLGCAREGSRQRPPPRLSPASPGPTGSPGPGEGRRGSGQGPTGPGAARAPWRLSGCTRRLVTVSVSASSSSVCRSSSRSRHPARSRSLSPGPAMAAPPGRALQRRAPAGKSGRH